MVKAEVGQLVMLLLTGASPWVGMYRENLCGRAFQVYNHLLWTISEQAILF